jgi:hypothetical protein
MLIRQGIQGRARGHLAITGPCGTVEHETFTCAHCSQVVMVPHRAAPDELGGRCHHCDAMVCPTCVQRDQGRCKPFEQRIEEYENRHRFLRSVG